MDRVFMETLSKHRGLFPNGLMNMIAENFSLLEDQARFLLATFALTSLRSHDWEKTVKIWIQFGSILDSVKSLAKEEHWDILNYGLDKELENITHRVEKDLKRAAHPRVINVICINDMSRLQLLASQEECDNFLKLLNSLRKSTFFDFTICAFYQNTIPPSARIEPTKNNKFLRNLNYLSSAVVSIRLDKAKRFYTMKSIYQGGPKFDNQYVQRPHTLIPEIYQTYYHKFEIGKDFYFPQHLCFLNVEMIEAAVYNGEELPNLDTASESEQKEDNKKESSSPKKTIQPYVGDEENDNDEDKSESTLPYTQARDPEQSRIFYYPDKQDDIDEDDPDNDLNF